MDIYVEHIVKRKKLASDYAIIAGGIFAALLITLASFLFNRLIFGFGVIITVFVWYGVYVLIGSRNLEYEYILTNNEMDIDKIIAKNGRKRIITIDFKEIEICANICDNAYKSEYENENNLTDKKILVGDMKSDNIYFVDFYSDGERRRVLFQPSEKILENLVKLNPRKVHA